MHRLIVSLLALLALLVTTAVGSAARAELRVVATTPDLAAVAKEIGGDHVSVTALALPTQDPHFVDARPHLALALARADLLLVTGLSLEVGWLPPLQTGARNGDIQVGARGYLDCSTLVERLEIPTARVDRSMGDVHPGGNPHYMFDPRRAKAVAEGIAARLAELDAAHANDYRERARAFGRRLGEAQRRWEQRLAGIRGQKVIGYHRSLAYLADWLGFAVVNHVEPRPGIPPNPRHVAQVLAQARRERVRVILQETFYPTSTSELIASRSGATLVVVPVGPDFARGKTYVDFLDQVGRALERAARSGGR